MTDRTITNSPKVRVADTPYEAWAEAIREVGAGGSTSVYYELYVRGIQRPPDLDEAYNELFRDRKLKRCKRGPQSDQERIKKIVDALYQARQLSKSKRISTEQAMESVSVATGISYDDLWNAQNGQGSVPIRKALSRRRAESRTN